MAAQTSCPSFSGHSSSLPAASLHGPGASVVPSPSGSSKDLGYEAFHRRQSKQVLRLLPRKEDGPLGSPGPTVLLRGTQTALGQVRPVGREESVSFPSAPSSSQVPDTWLVLDRGLLVLRASFRFSQSLRSMWQNGWPPAGRGDVTKKRNSSVNEFL